MKEFSRKEFAVLKHKVEVETSYNCHSEALKMIADFFGYPEYSYLFLQYSLKEGLSVKEFEEKCEASDRMFIIIEKQYGKDVVNELKKVL